MKYSPRDPLDWIDAEIEALVEAGLYRTLRTHAGPQGPCVRVAGRELVNFGGNDYLGLAADSRLREAAIRAIAEQGWGASASPLVIGHGEEHQRLEHCLAEFAGTEASLLFTSGYAANVGTIVSLVGPGDTIFSDAHNHASIIDGCRLSRARVEVYPHRDWQALATMLERDTARRRLIVTESVFSMEGDLAPLVELAELAERWDAMVLVDEAHATGLFGARGRGLCEALGIERRVVARVGTLSKALGSSGGFVCGSQSLIAWLINRARPYVFSTAPPPAVAAAAAAALRIVLDEPWRRQRLSEASAALRIAIRNQGWEIGASASQIIPLIIGDPRRTTQLSAELAARGLFVPAMRPPSVPAGKSLLRVSLSAGHSDEMIAALVSALAALRHERPAGAART
jgi:8-amino-7-oxononanoate synthase